MNPETWKQLEDAYYQFGELDEGARAEFLERMRRDQPDVVDEFIGMISVENPAFLEPPTLPPPGNRPLASAPGAEDLEPGTRLGVYRIDEWIAAGGMGAVYRASRVDDQFEQTVAIKVVKGCATSPSLLQRFHQERHTLAMLNHPHVARLLDGGTTTNGLPYLVMEYVDGVPIDVYCDERALPIEQRLDLFAVVCDAVHHLHQNLIVHRDIKPTNILVDSEGRPKLLDFGIAKVLGEEGDDGSFEVTLTGQRLMTPRYASPEQVRGELVTTASDVYSLGVLLYELMCGHEPYRLHSNLLHELERAVCETEPERPSSAVRRSRSGSNASASDATTVAPRLARARGTSVSGLRRHLSGDLDNVVLMAMRKAPGQRYGSAQQFAQDIRNVRDHRPVIACRSSLWKRATKFAQRNRLGAVLGVALLVSVVTGIAGVLWWANQTRLASERADREAAMARTEADSVRTLNDFLNDMLTSVQPAAMGVDVTVREVLNDAERRIDVAFASNPLVNARMRVTLGRSYLALGDVPTAERQFLFAATQAKRVFAPDNPELAVYLNQVAQARLYADDIDGAEEYLRQAMACFNANEDDERRASTLQLIGEIEHRRGDLERAEKTLRQVIAIRRASTGAQGGALFETLLSLATLLSDPFEGNLEEAEALLGEAIDLSRVDRDEDHVRVAMMEVELANILRKKGDREAALELAERGYEKMRARFGDNNVSLAPSWNLLSMLYRAEGQFARAKELLQTSLEAQRAVLRPDHTGIAYTLGNLAEVLYAMGDFAGAEEAASESLSIREGVPGRPDTLAELGMVLGLTRMRLEDYSGAHDAIEESLRQFRVLYDEDHPRMARPFVQLGRIAQRQDDIAAAEEYFRRAVEVARSLPPLHPDRADGLFYYASSLLTRERYEESSHSFRELLDILDAEDPPRLSNYAFASRRLAECLIGSGDLAAAEEVLQRTYQRLLGGGEDEETTLVKSALASLYHAMGDDSRAAEYEPAKEKE